MLSDCSCSRTCRSALAVFTTANGVTYVNCGKRTKNGLLTRLLTCEGGLQGVRRPVVLMLSSNETTSAITTLARCLFLQSPGEAPTHVMSDMADAMYKGAMKGIPSVHGHTYCLFHVKRAWKEMLRTVVSGFGDAKEVQVAINSHLNAIADVAEEEHQKKLIKLFEKTYGDHPNEKVQRFASYFKEQYCATMRVGEWCSGLTAAIQCKTRART